MTPFTHSTRFKDLLLTQVLYHTTLLQEKQSTVNMIDGWIHIEFIIGNLRMILGLFHCRRAFFFPCPESCCFYPLGGGANLDGILRFQTFLDLQNASRYICYVHKIHVPLKFETVRCKTPKRKFNKMLSNVEDEPEASVGMCVKSKQIPIEIGKTRTPELFLLQSKSELWKNSILKRRGCLACLPTGPRC